MLEGRDLLLSLDQVTGGPQPAGICFPSLQQGRVFFANATIFSAPTLHTPYGYPRERLDLAHKLGKTQMDIYRGWELLSLVRIVRTAEDLEPSPERGLRVVLLMEGADPIQTPDELDLWFEQGLRIVGLTWSLGTRYAGGNHNQGPLTPLGRELVAKIEEKGMIHDLSHLCDTAAWQLLEITQGPVIASHSNSRTILGQDDPRQLPDRLIQAIGQRNGIIGINLLSRFLISHGRQRRASLRETVQHIEHICEHMGHRKGIALGSDMDGGFGTDQLPQGIEQPADYSLLLEELARLGWNDTELAGFAHNNWLQWMKKNLPLPGH